MEHVKKADAFLKKRLDGKRQVVQRRTNHLLAVKRVEITDGIRSMEVTWPILDVLVLGRRLVPRLGMECHQKINLIEHIELIEPTTHLPIELGYRTHIALTLNPSEPSNLLYLSDLSSSVTETLSSSIELHEK